MAEKQIQLGKQYIDAVI